MRFPSGRTVWAESAEGLEISALGEGDSLRLYPVNDNELESVVSIEYLSCQGVVNNRLYIDELEPRMMSALFTQEMTMVGGTACTSQLPVQPCRCLSLRFFSSLFLIECLNLFYPTNKDQS